MSKVKSIKFEFINIEESQKLINEFLYVVEDILGEYNYSDYLEKVIFTDNIPKIGDWFFTPGGYYNMSEKLIVLKTSDDVQLSAAHELMHAKFQINNKNLSSENNNGQVLGKVFIDEYIAYRDSRMYYFGNMDIEQVKECMKKEFKEVELYCDMFEKCHKYKEALNEIYAVIVDEEEKNEVCTIINKLILNNIYLLARINYISELIYFYFKEDVVHRNVLKPINKYMMNVNPEKVTIKNCNDVLEIIGL